MKTLLALLLGCLGASLAGTQVIDTPYLHSGDIPGLVVTRTGHFDGKSLYGYMDGGAELYREYGFVDLTVQEVRIEDHEILVELFRMDDALSAFGIFSVCRGECPGDDSTAQYWCHTPGQVLCAVGRYFFRVQRLTGGSDASGLARAVAGRVLHLLPDTGAVVLPWIAGRSIAQSWRRTAMLVYGPLGLQNGFPDWVDALEGGGYRSITILPWSLDGKPGIVGWIHSASPEAASALERHFALRTRPAWQYIRRCEGDSFLVIVGGFPAERLAQFAESLLKR